jgi:hypothetical protein
MLYLAYLFMEFIEHKASDRFRDVFIEDRRTGPVVGAALGLIPFCGLADLGAGLYAGKAISLGTLVTLFLATSGETLLLALGSTDRLLSIVVLLLIKFCVAVICGFVIDLCLRNRQPEIQIHDICEEDHCHCEHTSIWLSAFKHILPIFIFILIFNLIIGILELIGVLNIFQTIVESVPYLGVMFSAIIGLIPGCAPLVLLLCFFNEGVISDAALLAGLFTSTGTGLLVLYKTSKSIKQNAFITLFMLAIGIVVGGLFELTGLFTLLGV